MQEDLVYTNMAEFGKDKAGSIFKEYSQKLFGFIRKRVNTNEDAEDIVQEVFYELSESVRLMQPIEQIAAWLYTVARNRIIDLYRKKKPVPFSSLLADSEDEEINELADLLIRNEENPESIYLNSLILEEISKALKLLPNDQREVFEQNEILGKTFKEISEETGVKVNTLLSRKRYAVLFLRERLKELYREFINY